MSADGYIVEDRGAIIKFRDTITSRSALKLHNVVYDHPKHRQVDYMIIDASEVTGIDPDVPMAISAVDLNFAKYNPDLLVFFVPGSVGLLKAFAEYQALLSGTDWRFFSTGSIDEAKHVMDDFCLLTRRERCNCQTEFELH